MTTIPTLAASQSNNDIKTVNLHVNLNKESYKNSKLRNHKIFSKGNKYYFDIDNIEEVAEKNLGILNLTLHMQPDTNQKGKYKVVSTNGIIKLNDQQYPTKGTGIIEEFVSDSGEVLYLGRIRTTYKVKSENIPGTMFVFFNDESKQAYVAASIGTINSEQSALIFGNHFDEYQQWIQDTKTESSLSSQTSKSKVSIASVSSDDWELAAYGTDNTTNRLDYPYGTKENSYPVIYLHAYKQDPRVLGGVVGKEKIRVIGQEPYVKSIYQADIAQFSYSYVEFWWDAQSVATIDHIYPTSKTINLMQYLKIFTTLIEEPTKKLIADLAFTIFVDYPSYGLKDTNKDGGMYNYAYNDLSLGSDTTTSVPTGSSGYDSVKYEGGANIWLTYTTIEPLDSWGAFARADADFKITFTNSSGYTDTMLVRTDPVTISHRIYNK